MYPGRSKGEDRCLAEDEREGMGVGGVLAIAVAVGGRSSGGYWEELDGNPARSCLNAGGFRDAKY